MRIGARIAAMRGGIARGFMEVGFRSGYLPERNEKEEIAAT